MPDLTMLDQVQQKSLENKPLLMWRSTYDEAHRSATASRFGWLFGFSELLFFSQVADFRPQMGNFLIMP